MYKFSVQIYISGVALVIHEGGLAQMVERSLSMREVPGSIPGSSTFFSYITFWNFIFILMHFISSLYVRMAERSKALRSGRSPLLWAWVRIPLLTFFISYC